jgi:luciferase family oxidoreductase group 1
VQAVPGAGLKVPLWILGSSLFGAQVAAALGLPFAFASHFAPAQMMQALEIYRARFKPSAQLEKPYVMLGYNVFAADTDQEAALLATSMQQAFVNLRSGMPSKLRPPVPGYYENLHPHDRAILEDVLSCTAIGSPDTVQRELKAFAQLTEADEIIVASMTYDHAARLRSYEIAAEAISR